MKIIDRIVSLALIATSAIAATSCSDDNDKSFIVLHLNNTDVEYTAEGYWKDCYVNTPLAIEGFTLTHSASSDTWEGVTYESWKGFCPTISDDIAEYPADVRVLHQWASITGGGLAGKGSPCFLACWDVTESTTAIPSAAEATLAISMPGQNDFRPVSVYITNSAYGYWSMKLGSNFNKPAGPDSWTKLHIHGVKNGRETGVITVDLEKGTKILDTWKPVDLTSLGNVEYLYFQMSSSDSGIFGMNVPAYFCLDGLVVD